MSDVNSQSVAFVRTTEIPPSAPPPGETGAVYWIKTNLFSNIPNGFATLLGLYVVYWLLSGLVPWIVNGTWTTNNIRECREVLAGTGGGCFSVLTERYAQMLFGFEYPSELYWRPITAFFLLFVAVPPILFIGFKMPKKVALGWVVLGAVAALTVLYSKTSLLTLGLILVPVAALSISIVPKLSTLMDEDGLVMPRWTPLLAALYPFVAFWLIWGGTLLTPLGVLAGLVLAGYAFTRLDKYSFAASFFGAIVVALVSWKIFGLISGSLPNVFALEAVESRNMGGFMLNMILGVVCVSLSIPLGIVLALGRQSSMPLIKVVCVVFIEFIRGVPLITLLFVANVVLAYFFPPDSSIDLILRVIIMITMFSSAYIAEVIRGGLAALPKGQYEAGDSLGLNYPQAMRLIILPQALKISIPGIVNVAVGLFKDTTLVSVISMFDMVGMIRGPILSSTDWAGVYWETWAFACVLFFVVCFGISKYSQWLEEQLQTGHR